MCLIGRSLCPADLHHHIGLTCTTNHWDRRLASCNVSSFMKSARRGIRFPAPSGAKDCSPGRKPWERRPTPRLPHPSPARAGEGMGVREGSPTHGSRRGLSSGAPIGAVEPFSEYGI